MEKETMKKLKSLAYFSCASAGVMWVSVYGLSDDAFTPGAIAICLVVGLGLGAILNNFRD